MENAPNGVQELSEMKEYQFNNIPADCIVFDDLVYRMNVNFDHPGGDIFKAHFQRDVSVHYRMMHVGHNMSGTILKKHFTLLGKVQKPQGKDETNKRTKTDFFFESELAMEIKAEIGKIVPLTKGYAPPEALLWHAVTIILFVCMKIRWFITGGSVKLGVIFSIVAAHMSLTIGHAGNHYEICRKGWVNEFLQVLTHTMGPLSISWFCTHQEHHAYTQHLDFDPDMSVSFFIRSKQFSHRITWRKTFQHIYVHFVGIALVPIHMFGTSDPTKNTGWILNEYIWRRTMTESFVKFIFGFCCFILPPILRNGLWRGVGYLLLTSAITGIILTLSALPNHNFDTVPEVNETDNLCWSKVQIESSANYCGFWMSLYTGGLNYQIEHHLFPRMHPWYYPKFATIVRQICKKYGVRYVHHTTFYEAWKAVLRHLYMMVH